MTESYPIDEDYFDHLEERINRPEQTKNLISDNVPCETAGTVQFAENFVTRYGDCHPMFFQGTMEEAFREATSKPAKDVSKVYQKLNVLYSYLVVMSEHVLLVQCVIVEYPGIEVQ